MADVEPVGVEATGESAVTICMDNDELSLVQDEFIRQRKPGQWSVTGYRERFAEMAKDHPVASDILVQCFNLSGVDVYKVEAPNARSDYHIVYFHGGGYVACSAETHNFWAGDLSRAARATVWNVDYRIAPEDPFPAAPMDTASAYRELVSRGFIEPERAVLAGESAGGGLVVATMLMLRDIGERLPAGAVCLSPWVDLAFTGASLLVNQELDLTVRLKGLQRASKVYLGDHNPRDPLASPLYANLEGLAPLLIQAATTEILLSDATRLAGQAESYGVRAHLELWEGALHFWQPHLQKLEIARQATAAIADFVECCIEGRTYESPSFVRTSVVDLDLSAEEPITLVEETNVPV